MAHKQQALREMALFAGAGGGILGGKLLGWECVCAVEWEPYPAAVLAARQNEGFLPPFPIWDDVQSFDGRPWRGLVDVVSGGFPCQDISAAGKGAGITGERSGMWRHMARIIGEVRPRYVLVENHKHLAIRGLGTVLGALATMGYDAEWGVFEAAHAGAPHERARMFILAMAHTESIGGQQITRGLQEDAGQAWQEINGCFEPECGDQNCRRWWHSEPVVGRVANGVAARVDRAKAIGNGQVPQVMAMAFCILHERLSKRVGNGA